MTLTVPPKLSVLEGWRLHEYAVASSTNLVASALQAWEAVRADTQTAGRGRFQRSWVSDEGGLWLSAVVPDGSPISPYAAHGPAQPTVGSPSPPLEEKAGERKPIISTGLRGEIAACRRTHLPSMVGEDDGLLSPALSSKGGEGAGSAADEQRDTYKAPRAPAVSVLPLVAGLAVCDALIEVGAQGLRLRWPNDVMVNDLKLAGVLLDQFSPGVAVVGIGVNVCNQPEARDAGLTNRTTRLADLLAAPPSLRALTAALLGRLRNAVNELHVSGFAALLPRLNAFWGPARQVELDLDGEVCRGLFSGVDEQGRLLLTQETEGCVAYAAHQVRHLEEV